MNIFLDIETIPCQRPEVLEAIRRDVAENFKAPPSLTKEQAASDLGMTDAQEIKFTSKDAMLAKWVDRFRDEKAEEVADEKWRKTSFDGGLGQIAVIGLAFDDAPPVSFYSDDWAGDEASVISAAFNVIKNSYAPSSDRRPVFVGHYVTEFDLRFIFQRAVVLGIQPPSIIPFHARPWDDYVFDTMTRWAGIKGSVGLGKLCDVLGIANKGAELDGEEIDGSMVWDFVKAGRIADVATYCIGDVERARSIFKRMTFQSAA